ncbi:septal ring lytic transglycosylase RlpA family protein [Roseomonas sp. BN140053]|uniref:septal ring lytic transglycosylase RlpA family protein n=1 Tax=Roseomonas sp. BN140053 TaxID=3391898 RepID=UPI0039EC8DDD
MNTSEAKTPRPWPSLLLGAVLCAAGATGAVAQDAASRGTAAPAAANGDARATAGQTAPDRSGRERRGAAAVIAPRLNGRRMADGGVFETASDTAASNSLPLGTTARVTNLRNGRVAMVRVRDRSADGSERLLHVSPKVAQFLGIGRGGVVPVAVAPLAVPQADGTRRLGQGTAAPGRRAAPAVGVPTRWEHRRPAT